MEKSVEMETDAGVKEVAKCEATNDSAPTGRMSKSECMQF